MVFWGLQNDVLYSMGETNKLGFPISDPSFIPDDYLAEQKFVVFRTCHSLGDWGIISAMPRLLKQKYPNCKVYLPSSKLLRKIFGDGSTWGQWVDPYQNVKVVFKNNPYVDGYLDSIEGNVFHDHYRVYDETNEEVPLIKQMLKFWQFKEEEIIDYLPEMYFNEDEEAFGDAFIELKSQGTEFGSLLLTNTFKEADNELEDKMLLKELKESGLEEYFYFGPPDHPLLKHIPNKVSFKDLKLPIRIQQYIRSKAELNIGYEAGLTTMLCRYSQIICTIKSERIKSNYFPNIKFLRY
tara:strand:+ start:2798 stop:3682 length:885 start_codon:yes stop_codon:yes gene_type:complete